MSARLAFLLATLGGLCVDEQKQRDRAYLESNGWICLGEEFGTGQVHWTNRQRGIGPGGPVTFQRALWLQRTEDAIAAQRGTV